MKKISILIFILFISSFFISSKSEAVKKVELNGTSGGTTETVDIISYTAPVDNELSFGNPTQIDFVVSYPKLGENMKSKGVKIQFYSYLDTNIAVNQIILNKTAAQRIAMEGKTETISVKFGIGGNANSKKYTWSLANADTKKEFLTRSFLLKQTVVEKKQTQAGDCTILSAKWDKYGEQKEGYYKEDAKPVNNISVQSRNCKTIYFSLYEEDGATDATDDPLEDSTLYKRSINVPSDNFNISIQLGEEECEAIAGNMDCDIYFLIEDVSGNNLYESDGDQSGMVYYECDGACFDNAKLLKIISNEEKEAVNLNLNENKGGEESTEYKLLAPIPGMETAPKNIGEYLNLMFKIGIGICAVLAVIMIVLGGIQYMGNESVFGKVEAKDKIWKAILGLLIALGAFALLNTIDPALLGREGLQVDQVSANIIDLPEAGDTTVDNNCKNGNATYSTNNPVSPGVTSALVKLKDGWSISSFRVYPSNNRMIISLKKGSDTDNSNIINILPGAKNYSEVSVAEKMKTPKGNWKIMSITTPGGGKAICNKSGSNMGATFWLLNPTNNGERGIGMHGNEKGTLSKTAGCLRLTNSDLLALLPYVKSGIAVNIKD
jgi:hypothetical protein